MRKRTCFRKGQKLADPKHHIAGVIAPLADPPQPQLLGEIGGRLPGKRRVGRAQPLSLLAVTSGAGDKAALRIALMVECQAPRGSRLFAFERQEGIIKSDCLAFVGGEALRDPCHLRVTAAAIRIAFKLSHEVAGIKSGQSRRSGAVPATVEAVAGEAGVARARLGAAVCDHPPILGKAIERAAIRRRAASQQGACGGGKKKFAHRAATVRSSRWFRPLALAPLLALAGACKPPPDQRQFMPVADAARGKAAIERVGCGSCHTIPGVSWPQGTIGPPLAGLTERALIAGQLPNRPDVLAAYIRNAPALVPGTAMPAMPVSEGQARDIAAYLYEQGAD